MSSASTSATRRAKAVSAGSRLGLIALLTCVAALFLAQPSRAAKAALTDKVAVLPLSIEGTLPAHARTELETRVVEGLTRADFDVVEPGAVTAAHAGAEQCDNPGCYQGVAKSTESPYVVRTVVSVSARDYELEVHLIEGDTGKVVATAADTCDICGFEEAGATIGNLSASLRRKLDAEQGAESTLIVESTPPGAEVIVDGELVGTTPLELPVRAGKHEVRVRKDGHITVVRQVALVEGVREAITLDLIPEGGAKAIKKAKIMEGVGWGAVAGGAVLLGVGTGLLVIDERPIKSDCDGTNKDVEGNCKFRYDTLAGGVVATIAGVAVLSTGIALVVIGRKKQGKLRASVGPTGFGLSLRF